MQQARGWGGGTQPVQRPRGQHGLEPEAQSRKASGDCWGQRGLPHGFPVRVVERPAAGKPGTPPPALCLGGSLEEPGPREGSRLPSPEARPGLPTPLWRPEKPEARAGVVPGPGGGGAARPARSGSCQPALSRQPRWCPSGDAAAGWPPVPALCSANRPEWRCGQGPAGKLVAAGGAPGVPQGGSRSPPGWKREAGRRDKSIGNSQHVPRVPSTAHPVLSLSYVIARSVLSTGLPARDGQLLPCDGWGGRPRDPPPGAQGHTAPARLSRIQTHRILSPQTLKGRKNWKILWRKLGGTHALPVLPPTGTGGAGHTGNE